MSGTKGEAVSKGWSEEASVGDAVGGGVDVTIVVWSEDVFCVFVSAPIVVMVRTIAAIVTAITAIFRMVGFVIVVAFPRQNYSGVLSVNKPYVVSIHNFPPVQQNYNQQLTQKRKTSQNKPTKFS